MIYAVIDTNVLVSALITKNPKAVTAKVVRLLLEQEFVPLYDADIIEEYEGKWSQIQSITGSEKVFIFIGI